MVTQPKRAHADLDFSIRPFFLKKSKRPMSNVGEQTSYDGWPNRKLWSWMIKGVGRQSTNHPFLQEEKGGVVGSPLPLDYD